MKKHLLLSLFLGLLLSGCTTSKPDKAKQQDQTTTVILIRHAEKADDGTRDPNLSPVGKDRAQGLVKKLAPYLVQAVYTTPYKRTRQTGKPMADFIKTPLQEYDPRDANFIKEVVQKHAGETILVVGHSNTIPALVNTLLGKESYEQLKEDEYDKLFIVQVADGVGTPEVLAY